MSELTTHAGSSSAIMWLGTIVLACVNGRGRMLEGIRGVHQHVGRARDEIRCLKDPVDGRFGNEVARLVGIAAAQLVRRSQTPEGSDKEATSPEARCSSSSKTLLRPPKLAPPRGFEPLTYGLGNCWGG